MKKIKILYAIDDPIEDIKKYVFEGNAYPKTYFWWDFTDDNSKYELYHEDDNKPSNGKQKLLNKYVLKHFTIMLLAIETVILL